MKQHKWHKEIKAWADGIDVEVRFADRKTYDDHWMIAKFDDLKAFDWNDAQWEFRIKPQPKEPQYLYAFLLEVGTKKGDIVFGLNDSHIDGFSYIGKIKLEESNND
jgi:hypothetical protein